MALRHSRQQLPPTLPDDDEDEDDEEELWNIILDNALF